HRPLLSTLLPSTTLFRSPRYRVGPPSAGVRADLLAVFPSPHHARTGRARAPLAERTPRSAATHTCRLRGASRVSARLLGHGDERSEEHTSELQSREKLVC